MIFMPRFVIPIRLIDIDARAARCAARRFDAATRHVAAARRAAAMSSRFERAITAYDAAYYSRRAATVDAIDMSLLLRALTMAMPRATAPRYAVVLLMLSLPMNMFDARGALRYAAILYCALYAAITPRVC